LELLIELKSPYRNKVWLLDIENAEDNIRAVLEFNFKLNKSSRKLKNKAKRYLYEIDQLKNQL